jgi:hypothetical protein
VLLRTESAFRYRGYFARSAWTLEWLILPQMVVATAGALRRASALLDKIQRIGDA